MLLADGQLHHVCVTWDSLSGKSTVYKDGALVKTIGNVKTGEQIKGGGIWVIGQDQDSVGAGFQAKDSFKLKAMLPKSIFGIEFLVPMRSKVSQRIVVRLCKETTRLIAISMSPVLLS